jgi:4-amino-4-deoxy-L-arabinose transferase-like glycosyltransferase
MVLLRSSLALFFGLLVTWLLGTALQKNKTAWWIAGGFATGISIMIHGYIVLFVLVWLLFLLIRFFREKRLLLLSAGGFSAGVLLAISPVMIRNSMVHAPVMSMSNNSAIGFISMNDKPFDNYLGWNVDFQYSSDIMAKSDGKLLKAIIPTLRTHDNVGGYIALLWEKLQATFGWFEIQNNVNYYFYRELNPVLKWTFLSFLLISPLAIAGLFLSFFRKLHAWPLYVMLLTFLAAMLGFMVLSRYRIVFAGILIPFAAFSVSEFFGSWNGRKNWIMLACIAVLIFWCAQPSEDKVSRINKNDYSFLWTIHYFPEISKEAKAQHFAKTEFMFRDFINRYEPGYIRNLKSYYHCRNKDEAEIFGFFADLHGNLGGLYNYVGQKNSGEREMEFANRLKKAAGQ